jgi:chorismate-pyruvate lyase
MHVTPEPPRASLGELFAPLARFYRKSGIDLPEVELVPPVDLPEPARSLLVHDGDMTSRLRAFHRSPVRLRVCSQVREEDALSRLVVLYRTSDGAPVEFGAIRIDLGQLGPEARRLVEDGEEPLGGILERCGLRFTSSPRAYFRYGADAFVGILLDEEIRKSLYGRCNTLALAGGRPFAEIVEILPASWPG